MGSLRAYLSENGGIRVYRNGYRVLPYGEPEDDWLGLDATYAKRSTVLAPVANRNFLGIVEIDDEEGEAFEETSSREGLIETDAFRDLQKLLSSILVTTADRIETRRGKGKKTSTREAPRQNRGKEYVEQMRSVISVLERASGVLLEEGSDEGALILSETAALAQALEESEAVALERDALLQELNLLRILASMGLTMAEFTHDFSALAQTLEIDVTRLSREAGKDPALSAAAQRLVEQFRTARAYTGYFAEMTSVNARRKNEPVDLFALSARFSDGLSTMFTRTGTTLTVLPPTQYDIRTVPMHTSEWSSILLNLLTNSLKAIRRARVSGRITIRVGASVNSVFLEFVDNGDGIPLDVRSKIFEPFFTTSAAPPSGSPDQAYALGTGLGLKIVSDIVSSVGGSITLAQAPEGFSTCFRIEVPAAE
jgi:signal transduction histidine kinase